MLKINAIQIEIHTENGEFGGTYPFSKGLNIIKGNNTVGKSTLFQAILYCLGMEELLGGKNERSMQAALRDSIEYPKGKFHQILQSKVFLEIENNSIVTIERTIKGNKSTKLLRVHEGGIISNPKENYSYSDKWIHDSGGAKNETRGFHSFLENFLDWTLPQVVSSDGDLMKLYIQTIFPSFIIEQKSGWSDFLSTIPYFGIKQAESRAVEFLLDLDVFEIVKKKQLIKSKKNNINSKWQLNIENLEKFKKRNSILVKGLSSQPEIMSSNNLINISIYRDKDLVSFTDFIQDLRKKLTNLENTPIETIAQNINDRNKVIQEKQDVLDRLTIEWEFLSQNLRLKKEKEQQYKDQLDDVRKELRQNKDVKKIYDLGGESQLSVSEQKCPTCGHIIEDSLFMQETHLTPMNIDENIKYVEAQEKMISAYLINESKSISFDESRLKNLFTTLTLLRKEIRDYKTELVSDECIPSIVDIQERLKLRNEIEMFAQLLDEITSTISNFFSLSEEWEEVLKQENSLPKGNLSQEDENKINDLEKSFKALINEFGYSSKSDKSISISRKTEKKFLMPVAESDGIPYNIRFDSSGSDLIRTLWAYYCALFKVAQTHTTNHPMLLMFDEPVQQDVSYSSVNKFLKELEKYENGQVFVFAAFGDSSDVYNSTIEGISNFHLIDIEVKTIEPTSKNTNF